MAYDRTNTGRWAWIKSVGAAGIELEPDWVEKRGYLLSSVWFPKHPRSIRGGDLLVYYAAGLGLFPAVMEVVTDEVHEDYSHPFDSKRWPWRMSVRPRLVVRDLDEAPRLDQVSIDPVRLRRQSHVRLVDGEWEEFRALYLPPVA
jgi:hypothetical protein